MKPTPEGVLAEAHTLKTTRYRDRDLMLQDRMELRFRKKDIEIPDAYKDTNSIYHSPAIGEEGKQVYAITEASSQPHVIPRVPEDQPITTRMEQWLTAGDIELAEAYGDCLEQSWFAQIHANIGWVFEAPKRVPYEGRPTPPRDDDDEYVEKLIDFEMNDDDFKRTQGIAGAFVRRHVPTETVYAVGNVRNPIRVYEVKQVLESELYADYNVRKDNSGRFVVDEMGTAPSGTNPDIFLFDSTDKRVEVVEYWDREWCLILLRDGREPLVLDEWHHNWGRVPYFACPAWTNETQSEHTKYEGPLDGLYAEVERLNRLVTMKDNTTYLRSYPSWQDVARESSEPVIDGEGNRVLYTKYRPGEIYHTMPGHEVRPLPMDVGPDLIADIQNTEMRIKQFSMSDVAKGISPGADTANSAITQLRRLQRSALERMAKNRALQMREIYKMRLKALKGMGESVPVFDPATGDPIELDGMDVVTLNLHVKYSPDTGQDLLIEEKQAAELVQLGLIVPAEFHGRRGKENPEEYVLAQEAWKLFQLMEPQVMQMVLASLGDANAIQSLIAANQQSGDARSAVPQVIDQMRGMQNPDTGIGVGSPDMPRMMGQRSPVLQETTQPEF